VEELMSIITHFFFSLTSVTFYQQTPNPEPQIWLFLILFAVPSTAGVSKPLLLEHLHPHTGKHPFSFNLAAG
jgi:hypothetical protein